MALVTTTAMNADDGLPDCLALGGEPQSQSNESEYPAPVPATTGDNGNSSSTGQDLERQDDQEIVPKYGALGRRALLFTPSWFSITMYVAYQCLWLAAGTDANFTICQIITGELGSPRYSCTTCPTNSVASG